MTRLQLLNLQPGEADGWNMQVNQLGGWCRKFEMLRKIMAIVHWIALRRVQGAIEDEGEDEDITPKEDMTIMIQTQTV